MGRRVRHVSDAKSWPGGATRRRRPDERPRRPGQRGDRVLARTILARARAVRAAVKRDRVAEATRRRPPQAEASSAATDATARPEKAPRWRPPTGRRPRRAVRSAIAVPLARPQASRDRGQPVRPADAKGRCAGVASAPSSDARRHDAPAHTRDTTIAMKSRAPRAAPRQPSRGERLGVVVDVHRQLGPRADGPQRERHPPGC